MRINSEFKDFYDIAMQAGQDQSLVYQRHVKKELLYNFPFMYIGETTKKDLIMNQCSHTIGFCGKTYLVVELFQRRTNNKAFCYKIEDVDKFVEKNCKKDEIIGYYQKYSNLCPYFQRRETFAHYFKPPVVTRRKSKHSNYEDEIAIKPKDYFGNSPIFVADYNLRTVKNEAGKEVIVYGDIFYNSPLKQLEFFRIFDPYQAFQEINMWLSNQATPMKPIPEMTDQIKIESKGFDKFSFRKDPQI